MINLIREFMGTIKEFWSVSTTLQKLLLVAFFVLVSILIGAAL